jgi:hypothetical protein
MYWNLLVYDSVYLMIYITLLLFTTKLLQNLKSPILKIFLAKYLKDIE